MTDTEAERIVRLEDALRGLIREADKYAATDIPSGLWVKFVEVGHLVVPRTSAVDEPV